jgi:S1-C subfamily serine protease
MRNFLSSAFRFIVKAFEVLIPIVVVLYFYFGLGQIKLGEDKQIAATEQIVDTQVAIYDALVQTQASNLVIQEQLAEGLEKAKKDAVKNNNQVMSAIYGVDKRSIDRSQGIVDGVNKVVDQVSYALQKPSYGYLKNITVVLMAKATDPNALPGHKGWIGTGVIIAIDKDFTYILTNRHVVGEDDNPYDPTTFHYYVKDGNDRYTFTPIKVSKDENIDLALVRINGHIEGKTAVVGFGPEAAAQDSVYLVGNNLGRPYLYDEGQVAGYDNESGDLIVDMPVGPGNSGSGVINKDGQLVGLLYAGSVINQGGIDQMDTGHGLCMDIKHIRLFLAGYIQQ